MQSQSQRMAASGSAGRCVRPLPRRPMVLGQGSLRAQRLVLREVRGPSAVGQLPSRSPRRCCAPGATHNLLRTRGGTTLNMHQLFALPARCLAVTLGVYQLHRKTNACGSLQAAATELLEAKPKDAEKDSTTVAAEAVGSGAVAYDARLEPAASSSNGNGSHSDNAHSNGAPVVAPPPVVPSKLALAAVAAKTIETEASTSASSTAPALSTQSLDQAMDPVAAGQVETAAATATAASAAASSEEVKKPTSAAGTPYANPGGRWSQFKQYSTIQRTWQIWSFACQVR
jgi:hypothetical protein